MTFYNNTMEAQVKKIVDKICSYAFLCYKKVLEAVLFD